LALAERAPGAALVLQDHADRPPRSGLRLLHRRALHRAAAVMMTARGQSEPFRAAKVLPASLPVLEVLESTTRFGPGDRAQARAASGLTGDPIFLWVARLDREQDPLCVLDAFARTADALPEAHLWMCHDRKAPLLHEVQTMRSANPALRERVTLLGARPHAEVELLLRAADFLVQGSGDSVVEALACGTTPLVTDTPALRRITGDGAVAALSRAGDPIVMGDAMVRWAARDRATLRRDARAHFEAHLSIPALGRELRSAYEAVTSAQSGGRVA
jgi:glycosyltransferase involved in cell wall biosynthesis